MTLNSKKIFTIIILVFFPLCPSLAFASGMEGFGFILVIFILFLSVTPGAVIKFSILKPENPRGILILKLFATMMMEAIFMAVSVIMGLKFVAGTGSVGYAPTFLYYAVPIYMMFALFPNLLLIKKKNVKFLKMMRSPKQFFKAVFISAVTPFFFGFMVTAVMY